MSATFSGDLWTRRVLCLAVVIGGLSAASGKAADNDGLPGHKEICESGGGTHTDLGGGATRCCYADSCLYCSEIANDCILECYSRECCESQGLNADRCTIINLTDWDSIHGGSDGRFLGLADLPAVESVLEPTGDSTQGSIIIVGGRVSELTEDGALLTSENPASDAMRLQVELMIAAMEQELADQENLDESDADSTGAMDASGASEGESASGTPDGGAVQDTGGAEAPAPAPAEQDRGTRRAGRRGRARR